MGPPLLALNVMSSSVRFFETQTNQSISLKYLSWTLIHLCRHAGSSCATCLCAYFQFPRAEIVNNNQAFCAMRALLAPAKKRHSSSQIPHAA